MTALHWAAAHPYLTATAAAVTLAALLLCLRGIVHGIRNIRGRAPAAVIVAAIAAIACTAYSADTSWRFAEHWLDMVSTTERTAMFAAGELALFACAFMARHNMQTLGAAGSPGVIVWGVTAVQVFASYAEGGPVGGTVRAVIGPVLAAVLWHLAMGLELRHKRPGALSQSLPAVIGREVRERLLSWLGLATRGRDAEQITRDRWTVRAVALAARLAEIPQERRDGRRARRLARRLSVAVGHAGVGSDEQQRQRMLALLAARRNATELATVALPSPWHDTGTGTAGGTADAPGAGPASLPRLVPVPIEVPIVPELEPVPLPPIKPVPVLPATSTPRRKRTTAKVPAKPKRTRVNGSTGTKFDADVAKARAWLAENPDLTGTEIGRRLGTGDSYGRRVRRAAGGTAQ